MNNCQPEDMTFTFKEGDKPVCLGDLKSAYDNLKIAQEDLDALRKQLVDTHEALTIVCGLVLDTVGQLEHKVQTPKEKQLLKILEEIGFKAIL